MKHTLMLPTASLLSIVLMTIHLTADTVHARAGTPEAGGSTLVAVPFLVLWLYATLMLAERRSGCVIMLVFAVLSLGMPVIHVMGPGGVFTAQVAKPGATFLSVWTLHAIGVTGMFSVILAVQGLFAVPAARAGADE